MASGEWAPPAKHVLKDPILFGSDIFNSPMNRRLVVIFVTLVCVGSVDSPSRAQHVEVGLRGGPILSTLHGDIFALTHSPGQNSDSSYYFGDVGHRVGGQLTAAVTLPLTPWLPSSLSFSTCKKLPSPWNDMKAAEGLGSTTSPHSWNGRLCCIASRPCGFPCFSGPPFQ